LAEISIKAPSPRPFNSLKMAESLNHIQRDDFLVIQLIFSKNYSTFSPKKILGAVNKSRGRLKLPVISYILKKTLL